MYLNNLDGALPEWPVEFLRPLYEGFLDSVSRFPDRSAIEVASGRLSYRELLDCAASIAATCQNRLSAEPRLTAVYAYRTPTAYAGVLAALLRGHGYVPLNPRFPSARTRLLLRRTGARTLIVDEEGEKTVGEVIGEFQKGIDVILPQRSSVADLNGKWPQHRFIGAPDLLPAAAWRKPHVGLDEVAYVLFTSGSTGEPKGVMVTHRNISHLLRTMMNRHRMNQNDRVSQFADLTFDPSVYDLFAAWECGACVCCPDARTLLNPSSFLADQAITIFQSVPSNLVLMKRLGTLTPDRFPKLRVSLFGGEPLPATLCREWQAAAPNSVIDNLYGPTEVTINSTAYRWDNERSPAECKNGTVPIGPLLPGVRGMIVDEELREVPNGTQGELLLAGPQRTPGYLNDPDRTNRVFVVPPGRVETYYRTGDSVQMRAGTNCYLFCGRLDFQVKVFGMRIELGEVEAVLREAAGVMEVAAIGWPVTQTGVGGIVAFIGGNSVDSKQVKEVMRSRLPQQMVPREIHVLEKLPLNPNGKVDRPALRTLLETRT